METNKIKHTFVNHLMVSGKKKTCETILLKSFKSIQKNCKKPHKIILKLAIINSTSTFRIVYLKKKKRKKKKSSKEIPIFITNNYNRIIWSINFILQTTKQKGINKFYKNLKQEIILSSQNEGDSIKIKTDLHKRIVTKKRLFLYYKW